MPAPADGPVTGVLVGVDVGEARVGVARTDPLRTLAVPVETVRRDRRTGADVERIAALVVEHEAVEVVVGLPRSLSGAEGLAAERARDLGEALAARLDVPVRYVDERLTTVSATRALREAGVPGRRQRAVVDQVAAVAILEAVLAAEQAAARRAAPALDETGTAPAPVGRSGERRAGPDHPGPPPSLGT